MLVCIDSGMELDRIFTLVVSGFVSICFCGILCFFIEDEFGLVETTDWSIYYNSPIGHIPNVKYRESRRRS
jgi:hypothetical protein